MTDRERYQSGQRIALKYELVRKLESGGMGTVWAAKNVDLDVHVALKLLKPELAETDAAARLLAEARMLARLQHPAVVRVHDCGRTEHGDPFVVMELLDGESLADHMARRGRISAVESVSLLLPVIDGVRAAHEAGIVHRDVKPENVFLANVGGRMQPKILDFGIALSEAVALRRTTEGAVMGSPAYMSPEQARGEEVGPSTDLWSLCVVLFELVSARLPFRGENYNAVLRSIIEDESPSLTELGCGDELFASIVERGLSKQASRRFTSTKELGTALAEWLLGQGVSEDAAHVSLRAGWLSRASEAPVSLRPVVVGGSDRPPAERSTLAPPMERETRASVDGLTLTTRGGGQRRRFLVAGAALVAASAVAGALWLRTSGKNPAAPSSAVIPETSVARIPSAAVEPPAPVVGDAGAERASPRAAEPRPATRERREPRRHAPAAPAFRPRGI